MSDVSNLISRIDAEFTALDNKIKHFQSQTSKEHLEREKRLEQFVKLLDDLRDIWRPRLEALAKRFGERVRVTPTVEPARRTAAFKFQSELANIDLRFSVVPDADVRQVTFTYNLNILPILMKFESNTTISFPLGAVDTEALGNWIDDRVVDFVKTYVALHENSYYLKGHLVEDPVFKVQFPKYAAAATVEWQGKTHYFVSDDSRQQFEKEKGIAAK